MKYFKHIEKLKFLKQISVWSPSILNKVQFDLSNPVTVVVYPTCRIEYFFSWKFAT